MNQLALPADVKPEEVERKKTLGASIELCAELGGFGLDKELQMRLGVDKGQFSRWQSGDEGIKWEKIAKLMDACGNDAPVLWMLHQRGYDLNSMRRRENHTEKALREAQEALQAEKMKVKVLTDALNGRVA